MRFPTGSDSLRTPKGADQVQFLNRRYSPDGRNSHLFLRDALAYDAGVFYLQERKIIMTASSKSTFSTRTIVLIGMFCAIAYVVMLLSKLIPINVAGFLTFDLKDVIIAICGLITGPVQALIVSVIVSFIEMLTISSTGPIGLLMNVLSSCAFVIPISLIYHKRRVFSSAIIGAVAGVLCMTVVMLLWNWLITPLYMGVDREIVISMLMPTFLPFNLLKGGINAALTVLLYKPVITALRRTKLIPPSSSSHAPKKGLTVGVTPISIFVVASLILVVLVWTGKI